MDYLTPRPQRSGHVGLAVAGLLAFLLALLLVSAARAGSPPGPGTFPELDLPGPSQGEAAVAAFGSSLPQAAAWYGMSTSEFARVLREDTTAWIDTRGRLFYVDEAPEPAETGGSDPLQAAPYPLSETFLLNSRPGSKRVIFLDFDGHVTTGTAWNASSGVDPVVSPPYNREGDSSTFTDNELNYIQLMWRQVAEDYAPFDVNVTTQDPGDAAIARSGAGDEYYGARVVITANNFYNCSCGGVAYLRAFDDTTEYYKPAWVFNSSVVGAGEAISHEAGHNLGLNHDGAPGTGYYSGHGSGATGWAPIMGVGYYKQLVQWSKGEYDGANNSEDDIARIQTYGAPLMADDHGDSDGAATALDWTTDGVVATLSGAGMIRRDEDVDVFSFIAGAGNYSIDVNPAPVAPNLDILAELYDSSGTLLASNNPADSLPASLSGSLAAGEYFLHVDGTGKGDPLVDGYSDYGSLGRYSVSGSVADPTGLVPPIAVAAAPGYSPGLAPLTVAFDAGASYDPDGGTVDSYQWDFGDGSASVLAVATNHNFIDPGTYTVALTVTDNDGLTDTDTLSVEALPPYTDQFAIGEIAGAGTVSGSYAATAAADGNEQSIQERESGGRKDRRYSYLEHTWLFDVQPGNGATLFVTARQSASSDGDDMELSYSVNGSSYSPLGAVSGTASVSLGTASGDVRIRVTDSDRNPGNLSLDTVFVDQLYIRTQNDGDGTPPPPPPPPPPETNSLLASGYKVKGVQHVDLGWQDPDNPPAYSYLFRNDAPLGAVTLPHTDNIGNKGGGTYAYRICADSAGTDCSNDAVVIF